MMFDMREDEGRRTPGLHGYREGNQKLAPFLQLHIRVKKQQTKNLNFSDNSKQKSTKDVFNKTPGLKKSINEKNWILKTINVTMDACNNGCILPLITKAA